MKQNFCKMKKGRRRRMSDVIMMRHTTTMTVIVIVLLLWASYPFEDISINVLDHLLYYPFSISKALFIHALPVSSYFCRRNSWNSYLVESSNCYFRSNRVSLTNLYNERGKRSNSSRRRNSEKATSSADWFTMDADDIDEDWASDPKGEPKWNTTKQQRPTPSLPSQYFLTLATSQFELMANSLKFDTKVSIVGLSGSKVKQAALYLPQENAKTGQLEFLPMMIYPNPVGERIFIANQIGSGLPPHMPKVLTKLPGFQDAKSLIPMYPFVSRSKDGFGKDEFVASGCGSVEEVLCDPNGESGAALSVPMFIGSQTVGVVLVWPNNHPTRPKRRKSTNGKRETDDEEVECLPSIWTEDDKMQISRVAYSLAMALMMDRERSEREIEIQVTQMQVEQLRLALSDNLHQIKNPLQALRAFGKLLQRKVALEEELGTLGKATPLRSLADNMIIQSDRVIDLLLPMDSLLAALEPDSSRDLYLVGKDNDQKLLKQGMPQTEKLQIKGSRGSSFVTNNSTSPSPLMIRSRKSTMANDTDRVSPYSEATSLGDFDLEMTFLADYIRPILDAEMAIASDRGIRLDVRGDNNDDLPGVLICPKSLRECITNLIDNAIKYVVVNSDGSQNLHPRIRVSLYPNERPEDPGVTIYVEDNGPGIPQSERDFVFSRQFRGHIKELVPIGDGIGLHVCKSMISRMGGTVEVVDRGDEGLGGTSMKVTLYRKPNTPQTT